MSLPTIKIPNTIGARLVVLCHAPVRAEFDLKTEILPSDPRRFIENYTDAFPILGWSEEACPVVLWDSEVIVFKPFDDDLWRVVVDGYDSPWRMSEDLLFRDDGIAAEYLCQAAFGEWTGGTKRRKTLSVFQRKGGSK